MSYPKNFIPKGKYDNTNYKKNNENNDYLGVFKDSFSLMPPNNNSKTIDPIVYNYSRQINQPDLKDHNVATADYTSHTNNIYNLGDPYVPHHGSNLNSYGKPITTFSSLDLIKNEVNELFRNLDENQVDKMVSTIESTHKSELPDDFDSSNEKKLKVLRINEYEKPELLDNNISDPKEQINEYIIYISSADRDCEVYPNPFNYVVSFNPYNTTNAYISRIFKNVKYISLRSVILPRKYLTVKRDIVFNTNNPTKPDTISGFLNYFKNGTTNNEIINYTYVCKKIKVNSKIYYFSYYKCNINIQELFWFSDYQLYLDNTDGILSRKVNLNILSGTTNKDLIANVVDNLENNYGTLLSGVINNIPNIEESGKFVLIYLDSNKIKFSRIETDYDDLIETVFEINYTNDIINTFNMYTLLNTSLENDRFLLLNINEIDTNYEYATDQDMERAFSILFPDYINGDYYYLDSSYHEKVFDHTLLGNITKMTINFKNSSGTDLSNGCNCIDHDIKTPKDKCICITNPLTGEKMRNYQCSHSYLRHCAFDKLQNTLLFKVGVIECTQNIQHF